jgi:putative endonuclease
MRDHKEVIIYSAARVWFNGRTSGCQSDDGSSILPTRTERGQYPAKGSAQKVFLKGLKSYFIVVQKPVYTGDKGQGTFLEVHEIVSKWAIFIKAVDISSKTRKEIGNMGEKVAAEYLRRHGFSIRDRNIARKTGELDLIVEKEDTLHFVEVKTILTDEFTDEKYVGDNYDPSLNLHEAKIRKVARTGEWYVLEQEWEGEWQVDGCLVWLRRRDGRALVRYLPQIVWWW